MTDMNKLYTDIKNNLEYLFDIGNQVGLDDDEKSALLVMKSLEDFAESSEASKINLNFIPQDSEPELPDYGKTLAYVLIEKNQIQLLEKLNSKREAPINVNAGPSHKEAYMHGSTVASLLAEKGHWKLLKVFVEQCKDKVNLSAIVTDALTEKDTTLLELMIQANQTQLISECLRRYSLDEIQELHNEMTEHLGLESLNGLFYSTAKRINEELPHTDNDCDDIAANLTTCLKLLASIVEVNGTLYTEACSLISDILFNAQDDKICGRIVISNEFKSLLDNSNDYESLRLLNPRDQVTTMAITYAAKAGDISKVQHLTKLTLDNRANKPVATPGSDRYTLFSSKPGERMKGAQASLTTEEKQQEQNNLK